MGNFLNNLYTYEKEILISLLSMFGVLSGVTLTFWFGLITKKSETKLKVIEKFIDKKLEAFEKLNIFTNEIRSFSQYENHLYPTAFHSEENLRQLKLKLFEVLCNSIWYSSNIIKELNFLQDYFVTLKDKIKGIQNEKIKMVGIILNPDFISISMKLDEMNKEYLVKEVAKLHYKPSKKEPVYNKQEKENRLKSLKLMNSGEQIQSLKSIRSE